MSQTILKVDHLSKIYPNGTQALKDVSFEVKKGEFLIVIGLSGSGKSTLLRCLNRLNDPTSGTIQFNGEKLNLDIAQAKSEQIRQIRKNIGMIFQHFNLVPRKSVLTNVLTGRLASTSTLRSFLDIWDEKDILKAEKYLDLVGIREKAHLRADQLSGGQQQRVAIARVLAQSPELILADEPVASLDPATCHTVMDYLRKVNQELGITMIANLHFLSLVREYASRVIALKAGEIVFEGSPTEINDSWFKKIYGDKAREVHIQ